VRRGCRAGRRGSGRRRGSCPRQGPPRLHRGRSRPRAPGPVCRPFAPRKSRYRATAARIASRADANTPSASSPRSSSSSPPCDSMPPSRELGEAGGEPRCLLVSVLLRVARVAANVRDQEGPQRRRSAAGALQAPRRSSLPRHARAKGTPSPCERKGRVWLLYVSAGSRAAPARCAFRRKIAFVCSCDTRDSVTPSTSPISRSVSSS
jgi:hypothetical protein